MGRQGNYRVRVKEKHGDESPHFPCFLPLAQSIENDNSHTHREERTMQKKSRLKNTLFLESRDTICFLLTH
jgi:hypothetical protein